jgi:hypothetical protein
MNDAVAAENKHQNENNYKKTRHRLIGTPFYPFSEGERQNDFGHEKEINRQSSQA